jgi:hypothetical protein
MAKKPISPKGQKKIEVMKENGIVNPRATLRASQQTGLPLPILCAILEKESYGGQNVWGHDPVRCGPKGGPVTQVSYIQYKDRRSICGMQGCGPMQLTWYEFQDQADKLGGCWKPKINIRVGAGVVKQNIATYGRSAGIARYNGSGPAAIAYSVWVRAKAQVWRRRFKKALKK